MGQLRRFRFPLISLAFLILPACRASVSFGTSSGALTNHGFILRQAPFSSRSAVFYSRLGFTPEIEYAFGTPPP